MSKNYKTYYTVRTAIIGADLPGETCFDNKDEAYRFYKEHDYVDKPVAHRVSNPDTIKLFDDQVGRTIWDLDDGNTEYGFSGITIDKGKKSVIGELHEKEKEIKDGGIVNNYVHKGEER